MRSLPSRTRTTSLTDDILLLFDFMFDSWVPFRALRRESYALNLNVTYTHSLDDQQLLDTLHDLQASDLLQMRQHKSAPDGGVHPCYSLTEISGKLWEAERQPLWQAYCTDVQEQAGTVTVRAPVLATAEAFLVAADACGLYRCWLNQWTTMTHHPAEYSPGVSLIPWKIFPQGYEVRALLRPDHHSNRVDWQYYEQRRLWWRTISELATLQRNKIVEQSS